MHNAVMSNEIDRHLNPDELEEYAMNRTSEAAGARIEEHLLICEPCRHELDRADAFVSAMRSAAKAQPAVEKRSWWNAGWLVPAFAGLALLLIGVIAVPRFLENSQPPLAISLTATRGVEIGASAPEGRRLALTPDLTGLAEDSVYRLEIVDENGNRTWEGKFAPAQGAASVSAQRSGPHFVRIYSSTGELLREYGLDVKR
jgi:hypothetical protein